MAEKTVEATAYLIIEARRSRYGTPHPETGLMPVERRGRVAELRVKRPRRLAADQIAVKVVVQVPAAAFDPISPAALIVVPDDLIQRGPIDVEAVDATEEGA